jgi:hypothetical protein
MAPSSSYQAKGLTMSEKPIAYEPHPVSPERKAELVAAGFRIIDAVYAPKGIVIEPKPVDALPDDDLRAAIKEATGRAPHPQTSRFKLQTQYNALTAE